MQIPIIKPAGLVEKHAKVFQEIFENKKQYEHFQNYLTALMVLENKSLSNISRCLIESADKTNLSRFLSQAPWEQEQVNQKRISYMMKQTLGQRKEEKESCLIVDDTLCEDVGSLFEYVVKHYDHCENRYMLAHNLVTSHYVSGAVRFPIDVRIYRRYEEKTRWEEFVAKHFPERKIPTGKERQKFHKEVDEKLLEEPEFKKLHQEFQTKITLAVELIEKALERKVPFKIVLMDSWYLAEEVITRVLPN
jgi:SRSO17 transposase